MNEIKAQLEKDLREAGWHSRGYIPHFDGRELPQFITHHLADSMPRSVLARWKQELAQTPLDESTIILQRRIERYLDQGYGNAWLKDHLIANMVQNSLLHFDGTRYKLLAWVVMPNHVHFLLTRAAGEELYTLSSRSLRMKRTRCCAAAGSSGLKSILIATFATRNTSQPRSGTSKTILSKPNCAPGLKTGLSVAHGFARDKSLGARASRPHERAARKATNGGRDARAPRF